MKKKSIFASSLLSIGLLFLSLSLFFILSHAVSVKSIIQITFTPDDRENAIDWSPNGNRLAFNQFLGHAALDEVAVANADGTNYQKLTSDPSSDGYPVWSPDGTKIVFISLRSGSAYWLMNSDGSNQHQISFFGNVYNYRPVWTSDGSKLIFKSQHEGVGNLYTMNIDGTNLMKLTFFSYAIVDFSYSPINSQIVFIVNNTQGGGHTDIWVMDSDGGNKQQLTFDSLNCRIIEWSPLGDAIAYQIDNKLYIMNPEGSNRRLVITFPNSSSSFMGWSSSGTYMALRMYDPNDIGNHYSLWTIKSTGVDLTRITPTGYLEDARWSPISDSTIAYSLTYDNWTQNPKNDLYIATLEPSPEPSIIVNSPNGGEKLVAGEIYEITWESIEEIELVRIEYSINNGADWFLITAAAENKFFYLWEVPCETSENGLIRISDALGDAYDVSDDTFSIRAGICTGLQFLEEAKMAILELENSAFKNSSRKRKLIKSIDFAILKIEEELYNEAFDILNRVLDKMNGCAEVGVPDKKDWIITCNAQGQVYPIILEATEILEYLIY